MPAASILFGAALLLWPAFANSYPLAFIDSVSYLLHTLHWRHPWDKTAAYGPLMLAAHWRISLWGVVVAQAVLLSWLLWRAGAVMRGRPDPRAHALVAAVLAAATTAPWFAALLMPDILAAVVVLGLFLLAEDEAASSRARVALAAISAAAIAAHLSHLGIAAALVALTALLRRGAAPALRAAAPLAAAAVFLAGANMIAFGKPVLSAHGSLFLLARLQADGPASEILRRHCPARGWTLCAHADALPMGSDRFLWSPDSPILRDRAGAPRPDSGLSLTGEAGEIVRAAILEMPLETLAAMLANTLRQALRVGVGDTLDPADLRGGVADVVEALFGPGERARFEGSRQMRGALVAAPDRIHAIGLLAALALLGWRFAGGRWRRERAAATFAAYAVAGTLANAFMTGALSGPHDRYGARIAWILAAAAALAWIGRRREGG
jgi:hypothetical protein